MSNSKNKAVGKFLAVIFIFVMVTGLASVTVLANPLTNSPILLLKAGDEGEDKRDDGDEPSPIFYDITVESTGNGYVTADKTTVAYNETVTVTIVPDVGYTIDTVIVNDEDVYSNMVEKNDDDNAAQLVITEIDEDKDIYVAFKISESADMDDVTWNFEEALRSSADGKTYVFASGKNVVFKTSKSGIRITFDDNTIVGGKTTKNVTIKSTKTIEKIEIRYSFGWHEVLIDNNSIDLNIVIDSDEPNLIVNVEEANENGYYNNDIYVGVAVVDPGICSGLEKVEYWVTCDGEETQRKILYSWSDGIKIQSEYKGSILVNAAQNNSDNVTLYLKITDRAGNKCTRSIPLDIDITAPAIKITYEDKVDNEVKEGYYTERVATVIITERTHHFDGTEATKGIVISAVDAHGNSIEDAYTISEWITSESSEPDAATHTAIIWFEKDANYSWSIAYTDKAGNKNTDPDTTGQRDPYKFAIDAEAPEGIIVAKLAGNITQTWDSLVDEISYGTFSNEKIEISGIFHDSTSSAVNVQYYMSIAENASDVISALDETELDSITDWKNFEPFYITANTRCIVYMKVMDDVGNYTYISTNGLIVDNHAPIEESVAPQVSVTPEQLYNGDVKVSIRVTEPMADGVYSGLKEISYKIFDRTSAAPNEPTQEGTLFQFNKADPQTDDLVLSWNGDITVESAINNSDDIQIVVYAVDNAGNAVDNSRTDSQCYVSIKIDTTAPVIDISYDNNSVDSGTYFKEDRIATIKITERNFNAEDVRIMITNADGVIPSVVGWVDVEGTYNQDDSTHIATISYTADGDYTFDIEYTDMAGNECTEINYAAGTVAEDEFTIDKTVPIINVTYDNNSVQNTNYYKEERTATIVINEHNFSTDRITIAMTAVDNGAAVSVPAVYGWSTIGNMHIATINYIDDAFYTFDISYVDLAGNEAVAYTRDTFYVDKTAPVIEISGVADKSANNGDIMPVITLMDTNFNKDTVSIVLDGVNNGNDLQYDCLAEDIANGQRIVYTDFEKVKEFDDLYTLTASLTDMAGNETTQTITFSSNRFGSVYDMSAVSDMRGKYHQTEKDIVFAETNVDCLERGTIQIKLTHNGIPVDLSEGQDYTIVETGGDGYWSQYQYTIKKELFVNDGRYDISVFSVDAAGNINENIDEVKEAVISFGIDKTNPIVLPIDLKGGTQYAVEVKTAIVEIKDNLILERAMIYLNNEGIDYIIDGETYMFNIPQSNSLQEVRIVAVDAAGNETEVLIEDILVSTNIFVRWYNNTKLFAASIGCMVILAAGVTAFSLRKKNKNQDK